MISAPPNSCGSLKALQVDAADRKQRPAEGDGMTVGTDWTNNRFGLSTRGAEGTKRVNVPIDPGQHYQDDRDADQ